MRPSEALKTDTDDQKVGVPIVRRALQARPGRSCSNPEATLGGVGRILDHAKYSDGKLPDGQYAISSSRA